MKGNKGLLKPTLQITFFSIIGIIVNFSAQLVIAYYFGAKFERDAYFAAIAIPTYISAIFTTLSTLFLPKFIALKIEKGESEANAFFSNLIILVTIFFAVFMVLGILFAKYLVFFTVPAFDENKVLFTSKLLMILLPTILFQSLTSLFASVYQTENKFIKPAIAPVVSIVVSLIFVISFHQKIGIKSLAYGTLVGSIFSFLLLLPIVIKKAKRDISFKMNDIHCIELIRVSFPLILTGFMFRSTTVIERMIASSLPVGSISYLGYANQVMMILCSLITGGFLVTLFPSMARIWSENNFDQLKDTLRRGIIIILVLTIPIASIFIIFGRSIFQIIFERGSFNADATIALSNVFSVLTIAFIANSLGGLVPKIFYFAKKTKLLALLEMISLIAYLIPAYILSRYYSYVGIAMASSFSAIVSISTSIYFVRKILKGMDGKKILQGFLKIIAATIIASTIAILINQFDAIIKIKIIKLFNALIVFAFVYLFMILRVFKIVDAISVINRITGNIYKFKL